MSFDQSFLIALGLLVLGSGCLKGNISTQVGTIYPEAAKSLRERGFAIFSTGINIGAVLGPLGTGAVAAIYGWHAGFALAAVLMLLALIVYLAGQRHLPDSRVRSAARVAMPPLTEAERRRVWALLAVITLNILPSLSFMMIGGIGVIWVDQYVNLATPIGRVPVAWFNSLDSLASIAAAPLLIALWAWQSRSKREPDSLGKIGLGSAFVGLSALLFALGSYLSPAPGTVSAVWALAGYIGMGFAFMWYWPVLLALVSSLAPAKVNSTMMGGAFLALFVGITAMGWVGSFYDQMSPAAFWVLDAAIALVGALLVFAVRGPLARALALIPQPN